VGSVGAIEFDRVTLSKCLESTAFDIVSMEEIVAFASLDEPVPSVSEELFHDSPFPQFGARLLQISIDPRDSFAIFQPKELAVRTDAELGK
jgi:hypothetical protein